MHNVYVCRNSTLCSLNTYSFYFFKKPLFWLKLILWVFVRHSQSWSPLAYKSHTAVSVQFPSLLLPLCLVLSSLAPRVSPSTPLPSPYTFLLSQSLYLMSSNLGYPWMAGVQKGSGMENSSNTEGFPKLTHTWPFHSRAVFPKFCIAI